jgi:hypothetical protein
MLPMCAYHPHRRHRRRRFGLTGIHHLHHQRQLNIQLIQDQEHHHHANKRQPDLYRHA